MDLDVAPRGPALASSLNPLPALAQGKQSGSGWDLALVHPLLGYLPLGQTQPGMRLTAPRTPAAPHPHSAHLPPEPESYTPWPAGVLCCPLVIVSPCSLYLIIAPLHHF